MPAYAKRSSPTHTVNERPTFKSAIIRRMKGPGGYYNIGNIIGLVSGLEVQIMQSRSGILAGTLGYFAGSNAALFLTIATVIFLVSGECYHRAWANGFPPEKHMTRWGDFLSGVGAVLLGVALFILQQPVLAATAGAMHALGKFGSAFSDGELPSAGNSARFFRNIVVLSRVPAIVAAAMALFHVSSVGGGIAMVTPATLLVCYVIWAKADMLLLRGI